MEENNDAKPFAISKKLLLSVYGIAPLILVLVFLDTFFFNFYLKNTLGINATHAAIYVLFLELPHILASFIGYADTEYILFYKQKVLVYLPTVLCVAFFVVYTNVTLAFFLYMVYTMYHSIKQQAGIAKMLVGKVGIIHELWSHAAIVGFIVGNLYVFAPFFLHKYAMLFSLPVLTACVVVMSILSIYYLATIPFRTIGWLYVCAITFMFLTSYLCAMLGYLFFSVFVTRIVHDSTAFIFYAVHDSNRNARSPKNILYKILKPSHIPVLCITPVVAMIAAYLVQRHGVSFTQSAAAVILSGVAHYYLESFMWKRDSIHRKQLRFVA